MMGGRQAHIHKDKLKFIYEKKYNIRCATFYLLTVSSSLFFVIVIIIMINNIYSLALALNSVLNFNYELDLRGYLNYHDNVVKFQLFKLLSLLLFHVMNSRKKVYKENNQR